MIAFVLAAALVGAVHGPTDPATQASIDTPAPLFPSSTAIFNPGLAGPGDHLLCHFELEPGSRFGHQICLTREDWAFLAANGQGFLEFIQARSNQFQFTRQLSVGGGGGGVRGVHVTAAKAGH